MDIYEAVNKMKTERKTVFDLNIRVTFYARVSTTSDEQENSIENQIAFFTNMIKANKNWEYIEGYADRIRGESAANRVQFLKMVEDGKQGKFDLVLTKEISRFARNTIDSLTYTRELLKAGVGVFFQNDNICTIDSDSELRLTIMSSIAADEVRKLSERVKFGHKRAIESGHVIGNNRIFGYNKSDCKLVINEAEAEMVRLIFELYSTGIGLKPIEQILYDKGYRGRNNNRIHHNTIGGIIQNPKYKGYYCGNKVKIVDYRTKEQRYLPKEEWVMYRDETGEIVPAIVDEELWNRCNEIFKERSEIVKSRGHSYKNQSVFSGKLRCTVHNVAYWRTSYSNTRSQGKPIYTWLCGSKRRFGHKTCDSFSIMEKDLYQIMSDCYKDISNRLEYDIDEFIKPLLNEARSSEIKKRISDIKTTIARELDKKNKLLDLYTDGIIDKNEFSERNKTLSATITELQTQISSLEEQCEENIIEKKIKSIKSYIEKNRSSDGEVSNEQVEQFVSELVDTIMITPVDINTMNIVINLKTGKNKSVSYTKNNSKPDESISHLGTITKKMVEQYQQGAK